ncbi:MAG: hypothetical protein NZ849_09460 [Meiothermus sp.]|uniref:hypothetical protein n=1 Tax=Meiothermus sp. TaxID=1955249 RepID=UPI0025EF9E9E|nr:hypothetical protein [Meiothermus sp.]MCS7058011.1 hypothetical protein [Meiothermus sp.]MCS7195117.1 hypothetical protein [Meiothermus sp.]MCX7740765.1 hypothetical protein [Meiothermus sp.]MDW8091384.1 hypothetical protein [Meiothermus sp.]MDW8482488.1 hypothetical protein [Meiothermus sp.]
MLRLLLLGALVGWSFGQGAQLDERRIGPEGGALRIPGIQVWVPPGALHTPVRFRLERLQAVPTSPPQDEVFFIQTLPDREVVGIYRLSSSATSFLKPLEIELRVNPPYRPGGRVIRSVVYIWNGKGYVSIQVPSSRETLSLSRLELGLGAGAGGYPAGLVLAAIRAPEENLRQECHGRGGRWTGTSCERR